MANQLLVGVSLDGLGCHPAAECAVGRDLAETLAPQYLRRVVRELESGGFGLIVFPDSDSDSVSTQDRLRPRLDPIEAASFAAACTNRIGLVPVASPTHSEPYHLSNQLSSLDYASRGRAGWHVDIDVSLTRARLYGRAIAPDQDTARREAEEVVDVVRRLWDSWEDGALMADERTGRFLDREKIHYIDHRGEIGAIRGPALLPRPIQGQVVLFAAAGRFADPMAEVALVNAPTERELLGASPGTARRRFAEIEVVLDAADRWGTGRLAELDATRTWNTTGRLRFVGSADRLVALLRGLADVFDGVIVHPAVHDIDVAEIAVSVLPRLRSSGLLREAEPGATLRQQLRLPRPASRYGDAKPAEHSVESGQEAGRA